MSAAIESKIHNALADAFDSYVAANPVSVAYPGIPFTPVAGQPFLRPWLLPAPTIATDWQRSNDYSGIFSVDVFWPAGQGIKSAMAAAANLIDFFVGERFVSGYRGLATEKLVEDGTTDLHFAGTTPGTVVLAGTAMRFSIAAKAAERHSITLISFDGNGFVICEFDLVNGVVVGQAAGCSPSIYPIGNGEFLLTITWSMLATISWFSVAAVLTSFVGGSHDPGFLSGYAGTSGYGVFIGAARSMIGSITSALDLADTVNAAMVIVPGNEVTVQINDPPYLSPAQQEPGWLQIPVNIRYRAFASASGVINMTMAAIEAGDTAAFHLTVA